MRRGIYVILTLFLMVLSCDKQNKPKKPDNLIPEEKMEGILYDMYIINAAKGVNRKILQNKGIVPETYILKKHQIDSAQFAESNAYYAFDPDLYKSMVESVKTRLENDKKVFEALEKKEGKAAQRRRDSIKTANEQRKDSIKKALKKEVSNIN